MEILSRLLAKKQNQDLIQGVKVYATSLEVSYLLFVDDIFIFHRTSVSDALDVNDTLKLFSNIMGQVINYDKSRVIFRKKIPYKHHKILQRNLKIKAITIKDNYLGAPLFLFQ